MADEEKKEEISPIEKLRSEFASEVSALRETLSKELEILKTKNEALEKENSELHRALVRSAVTPTPEKPVEKTEEEKYSEKIALLAKKTLEMM